MKQIEKLKEADTRIKTIFSEFLNKILEYLEVEEFKAISGGNSQASTLQQTRKRLPILVICDTKMLEPDDYSILTTLSKNTGVAIIPFNSLTGKTIRDKCLTESSKKKKLLREITARLELQINYKQEGAAKIHQDLEIPPDEIVEPAAPNSIFPSISELNGIFDFIEAHYHQPIGLHDVAQSVGYSAAYLTDLVRRKTGQSVHRWITKRRMVAACSLLLETDQSIDCIAEAVGYRNRWCFFRLFRKNFGMTPGDWRSACRSSAGKTDEDIA